MSKPHIRLRLVAPQQRPLAALTMAEKRANAIAWLRERGRYVLQKDAPKPNWGIPGQPAKERK